MKGKIIYVMGVFVLLFLANFSLSNNSKLIVNADSGISIDTFKTSYATLKDKLGSFTAIQLFGGGTVVSERSAKADQPYAGELGAFWAPPFYSSDYQLGIVLFNRAYADVGGRIEEPSDINKEAVWYPSKGVVTKNYAGGSGGTDVTGVKIALPGDRGFALKLTLTNRTASVSKLNVMFLNILPTFDALKQWSSQDVGWNWKPPASSHRNLASSYNQEQKMIIIANTDQQAYMAVGLNKGLASYGISNDSYGLYTRFHNPNGGSLDNNNTASGNAGSDFGLVGQFGDLASNQSDSITMIAGIGSTPDEAIAAVNKYRGQDVETAADSYWNNRLSTLFSNAPTLSTADQTLNQIYRNVGTTYLMNKWDTLNAVGFASGFPYKGGSTSLYAWLMGDTSFLTYADPALWKIQLKRLLAMDYNHCRATDPISGSNLCDVTYSYSKVSLIDAIYRYITIVSDFDFLSENVNGKTVFDRLNELLTQDDQLETDNNHLADYGADSNLYELNRHCQTDECFQGGQYTGEVVSPNAERAVAHLELADLAEKLPSPNAQLAAQNRQKATEIQNGVQSLWNPSANWFDTISLYQSGPYLNTPKRVPPPRKTIFLTAPLLLLQYDNLLNGDEITGLISHLGDFKEDYGLASRRINPLEIDNRADTEPDWHGHGLYSGAVGAVLTGLFKNGQADLAYDLLSPVNGKGYAYLAQMPYFSQAFLSNAPRGDMVTAYLEGVSVGQSIIEGMFGVQPNTKQTKIAPHIPSRLLQQGPVSLHNIRAQSHIFDVTVTDPQHQQLSMAVSGTTGSTNANHFRFEYEANANLSVDVTRLAPNQSFAVSAHLLSGSGGDLSAGGTTDSSGKLHFDLPLQGAYLISGAFGSVPSTLPKTAVSIKINGQDVSLQGGTVPVHLTGSSDVTVEVTYSDNTTDHRIIRFIYNPPIVATPIPIVAPTQVPTAPNLQPTPIPSSASTILTPSVQPQHFSTLAIIPQPSPSSSAVISVNPYDLNGDGVVNSLDMSILLNHWSSKASPEDLKKYDFNHDGTINTLDYFMLLQHFGK